MTDTTESRWTETDAAEMLDPSLIMQIGMGFWPSKAVLSAVELGLFTATRVALSRPQKPVGAARFEPPRPR